MAETRSIGSRQQSPSASSEQEVDEIFFNAAENRPYTFLFHPSLHRFEEECQTTKELIEENGGAVVQEEATADVILADSSKPLFGKLSRQIIETTRNKHVESPRWVETTVIVGKLEFTRSALRMGRKPGEPRRDFTPSDKIHIVYYLAHRAPYVYSTQKWHFAPPAVKTPYRNNVLRAGNKFWKQLCESDRPWAQNHSWHSWREQYVRNRAQYDWWIRKYVEDNPQLLEELSSRLIEDFVDEPGAHEEELDQRDHGRIISTIPDPSYVEDEERPSWPSSRYSNSAQAVATPEKATPHHPLRPPSSSQGLSNLPDVPRTTRPSQARLSRPSRSTQGTDYSWLVNSSDDEEVLPPDHATPPISAPAAQVSTVTADDEFEEEQSELLAHYDSPARDAPTSTHQYPSPEDFRLALINIQNQNSVPVTKRRSLRRARQPSFPPTSPSTEPGATITPPEDSQSAIIHPDTKAALVKEFEILSQNGLVNIPPPVEPEVEAPPAELASTSTNGLAPSFPRPARAAKKSRPRNVKPKAFKIGRPSQAEPAGPLSRQEEIAESALIYHLAPDGGSAMIRRNSKSGTPVRGAQRLSSAHSPSSRRTSLSIASFTPAPFKRLSALSGLGGSSVHSSTFGEDVGGQRPVPSASKRRRLDDETNADVDAEITTGDHDDVVSNPSHLDSAAQSRVTLESAFVAPMKPFGKKRRGASANPVVGVTAPSGGGRRLRSASVARPN